MASLAWQSERQISDGIQEQFWLYWNVLRRSPAYRRAHARLIKGWKAELSRTDFDEDVHVPGRRQAVQRALQACIELKCSQLSPDARGGDVEESMMVVQAAEASRYYSVPADLRAEAVTKWLSTCERRDALPELSKFAEDWGVLFPIPPQYNPVPEDQICAQSVKPVTIVNRSWKSNPGGIEHTLVVHLKLNAARRKREVLAYLEGALDICFWRETKQRKRSVLTFVSRTSCTGPGEIELELDRNARCTKAAAMYRIRRRLPASIGAKSPDRTNRTSFSDREQYQRIFRAIDLRSQNVAGARIAEILWPGRRKGPQAVYDLQCAFTRLAKEFQVPLTDPTDRPR